MSKHTPGPWTTLAGDWDKELEGYCRYTIKPLKVLNIGDASLIAAAPEMYEALEWALHALLSGTPIDGERGYALEEYPVHGALTVIRKALAKAEGRQ